MRITILNHTPFARLEQLVRQVPLKQTDSSDKPIFVYENSRILLRQMHPDELNPGSKYILQAKLDFQRELQQSLRTEHGIDIFNLEGAYTIRDENDQSTMTIVPPIVEVTEESMIYHETRGDIPYKDPTKVRMNVIVDGLHRLYLARFQDTMARVIHIDRVPLNHPFYALPNRWDEVKILQGVPDEREKKNYRRSDGYALYRDFGILGCGEPRRQ